MPHAPILKKLQSLARTLGWSAPVALAKLHGDASARTYYRVTSDDNSTVVLMVLPEGPASASEEITAARSGAAGQNAEPPFLPMARSLRAAGLPVPQVFHYSTADRWILLEDVGTISFHDHVAAMPPDTRLEWYHTAIDLLIDMQRRMSTPPHTDSLAHHRSFDATLLNWEFDHCAEYLLAARGHALPAPARVEFTAITRAITQQITTLPPCFTHRDFQSRNLMVRANTLVLIDFQDALLGPCVYDLVALLRDSYVVLPLEDVMGLVEYYGARCAAAPTSLPEAFHEVTLQRKMKDAGRFVYIDRVRNNPNFLPYIPATLDYVRTALLALPTYRPLYALLQPYVPEWQ